VLVDLLGETKFNSKSLLSCPTRCLCRECWIICRCFESEIIICHDCRGFVFLSLSVSVSITFFF